MKNKVDRKMRLLLNILAILLLIDLPLAACNSSTPSVGISNNHPTPAFGQTSGTRPSPPVRHVKPTPTIVRSSVVRTPPSMHLVTPTPTIDQALATPSPTPTIDQATATPPPTQITAEAFRVYFNSANTSGVGVSTQHTYAGTVSILVSGYGQASSTEYSDAFYIYTDTSGNPITPHTATCWVMYINGRTADASIVLPSYNSSHTYSLTMNVSQPSTINFGICDGQPSDNTGYLTVTVQQE